MTSYVGTALTPLIGRERELRALESRLASGARLITMTGPGGSGKTTLAREVFGRRRGQGTEAYFVDLVGIRDPGLVPAEIATELGVTETKDLDAGGAVVAALRETAATIVLDNLEELTGARDFIDGLMQAAQGLQLITTSRIPLGVHGEVEFQVPPLDLPLGDEPDAVAASPAGALFLERARAIGRLGEVDAPTAQAIAQLCRRLDGLPLALELAAARTRILPPVAILRHLADHTSGLLAKGGDRDTRHESLDAVLNWSLDLLEQNEAEVLGAVAICPGGFDLAMAEALAPDRKVLQAIDVLATHGLLSQRGEIEGEPWYRLLETIRAAALERSPEDKTNGRWARLATHMSERVAGTLEAYYRSDDEVSRRLDVLLDDIRGVLDWTEGHDPALTLSISARFWSYWRIRGRSREGVARLRAAIAANPTPSSELATAYNGLAQLERHGGAFFDARQAGAQAVRIARIIGDSAIEIDALGLLIEIADVPMPEATNRLRELLPIADDPVSRYFCLTSLALADRLQTGIEATIRQYRDAEAALSGTPYRKLQGTNEANLANLSLYADRPADAYEHCERALVALTQAPPDVLAWIHSFRAIAASTSGQLGEAIASLRSAINFANSSGTGLRGLAEVMIAAVAVLSSSGAPLLAAKAWGATEAGDFREFLLDDDRVLGERLLVAARRATDPVAFELALKAGQKAGVDRVAEEVLAHLDGMASTPGQAGLARLQHGTLTQREIEILALVGAGKSDTDIAAELFISPKTASVHVSNAKAKLGVETRLEAALWAREQGLVDEEPTET